MSVLKSLFFMSWFQLGCLISASALPPIPSLAQLPDSIAPLNTPPRPLLVINTSDTIRNLPPDPYIYYTPGISQPVKLYGYGALIPNPYAVILFDEARRRVMPHLRADANKKLGTRARLFRTGPVALSIHPGASMTWADWGALCLALIDWRQRYDVVEMDFDVFRVGDGRVGGGILKITKLNGDLGAGDGVSPL